MSVSTPTARLASPRQRAFLNTLRAERGLTAWSADEERAMTGRQASAEIERVMALPRTSAQAERREAPDPALQPGVYEVDGVAYIVKPTRKDPADPDAERRLYAKRVEEIGGTRVTEAGTFVAVDFVYDRGAIFRIRPEDRMSGERAKALTLRYGRCICCGRDLRAGESVEQGIGPVCVKSFPELVEERKAIQRRARAGIRGTAPAAEAPEPVQAPVSLVEMAAAIERRDDSYGTLPALPAPAPRLYISANEPYVETHEVLYEDDDGFDPESGPIRRPIYNRIAVAQVEAARAFIVQAIDAYEFEAGPLPDERERALAVFDALAAGTRR